MKLYYRNQNNISGYNTSKNNITSFGTLDGLSGVVLTFDKEADSMEYNMSLKSLLIGTPYNEFCNPELLDFLSVRRRGYVVFGITVKAEPKQSLIMEQMLEKWKHEKFTFEKNVEL